MHRELSRFGLLWLKFIGCTREFGLLESLRRTRKETLRALSKRSSSLDISWIDERTAIGAAPKSPAHMEELKALGVTDIIDLRAERNGQAESMFHTAGIHSFWVPTYDDWLPKGRDFFAQLCHQLAAIHQDPGRRLLICCGAGEHRAPLGGVVALIVQGHCLESAQRVVEDARPVAELLPPYLSSLREYVESELHTCADRCNEWQK